MKNKNGLLTKTTDALRDALAMIDYPDAATIERITACRTALAEAYRKLHKEVIAEIVDNGGGRNACDLMQEERQLFEEAVKDGVVAITDDGLYTLRLFGIGVLKHVSA